MRELVKPGNDNEWTIRVQNKQQSHLTWATLPDITRDKFGLKTTFLHIFTSQTARTGRYVYQTNLSCRGRKHPTLILRLVTLVLSSLRMEEINRSSASSSILVCWRCLRFKMNQHSQAEVTGTNKKTARLQNQCKILSLAQVDSLYFHKTNRKPSKITEPIN